MNDTMIEAMSQFEIPRPILRSSVWPTRHCVRECSFYGYGTRGRACSAVS
jgi:hypothetical protein